MALAQAVCNVAKQSFIKFGGEIYQRSLLPHAHVPAGTHEDGIHTILFFGLQNTAPTILISGFQPLVSTRVIM